MTDRNTANNKLAVKPKRKAPPKAWKKGQSGNPKGAPKRGESWAEIIKRVGEMTPSEAAERSLALAKQLLEIGDGVTLKEAVVLRVYSALMFDPQPGLLNAFMDRVEGKVSQPIEMSWKDEARRHGVDPDKLVDEFVAAMGVGTGGGGSVAQGGADEDGPPSVAGDGAA